MIRSLALFLIGSHLLAATPAPVVAVFRAGTGGFRRFMEQPLSGRTDTR